MKKIKNSLKVGVSFGITSGIITTLGLMVGLTSGTNSRLAVLGGIITIAVADSFSDALGIHISEESNSENSHKEVWESTIATFLSKFLFALTFVIPILLTSLYYAIIINIIWGFFALAILSYFIAKQQKENPVRAITEHIGIATIVIIITYFVGEFISITFV